ncbi:MAG: N-acetylneuraminate synthase family protein [Deltaproteobacteria bacterium]|nr:N-acetylneuraminate synthase family protein [Deltaproteobacteria bacterium]
MVLEEKKIKIGKRFIGKAEPVFIIAEVGSNHDGSLIRAKELINASKDAGADAVKFQSFTAEGLINPLRPENGVWRLHPAYPVIERLALPRDWHFELKGHADSLGIMFISAPFDVERAALLDEVGVEVFKLASGELTNEGLIAQVAAYKKPMIISTGAAFLAEVERAIEIANSNGCFDVALLHCVSLYPPSFEHMNLRSMVTMREAFGLPVGCSDHTQGSAIPIAAVALGASIIEKHITSSRKLEGPDHPYALEVQEFASMVKDIRHIEKAMGSGVKRPSAPEMGERVGARRSIYAAEDIEAGALLTPRMLKVVRHAYGLLPSDIGRVIGMRARKKIMAHHPIKWEDIESNA